MKGRILVQIILGLHFAAAKKQYNQYQSFLGCFKDDGKRDIKKIFWTCQQHRDMQGESKKEGLQILRSAVWR
jgi:hypothetical protein